MMFCLCEQVLIIGGGDGGVLREVVKHPMVESVVQCEIDEVCIRFHTCCVGSSVFVFSSLIEVCFKQDVINVSKKYLPGMAKGFFSPKLTLNVGDGFEFMKKNQNAFDVIITDSSDPVGERGEGRKKTTHFLALLLELAFGPLWCIHIV